MPWSKLTYERTISLYKELLDEMFNGSNRDFDLLVKELLIRAELLKRDFTKRQLSIILFVFTFSFAYNKDSAYIPKLMDFQLAGISRTKIKSELRKLAEMNVITWNQEETIYTIEDPRFWDVPYNSGYNDERSKSLFIMNLDHAGYDVSKLVEKLKQQ